MTVLTERQIHIDERGIVARTRGQRIRKGIKRDLKRLFIRSYAQTGNVSVTCRALLVSRNTVYQWMRKDSAFSERYQAQVNALYPQWTPTPSPPLEEALRHMSARDLMTAYKRLSRKDRFW